MKTDLKALVDREALRYRRDSLVRICNPYPIVMTCYPYSEDRLDKTRTPASKQGLGYQSRALVNLGSSELAEEITQLNLGSAREL